ncbi:hypothetical protein EBQ34_01540 [Vandammella animalimorsus]|uniref:Major facilitator superfamily (MFS) profile domain-containing protein n=2 Tax=Vandammella animalimorsus TaxID=2029117 RepID=A0A3M6RU91_9BURK|nr:hypothetical protein EBQ34_01540 [Vandammella animalimorsus]
MFWLLGLCAFTSMAAMRLCDAMLPALAEDFGGTTGQPSHAISGFALAYGLLQLFYSLIVGHAAGVMAAAWIIDRLGPSTVFFISSTGLVARAQANP